MCECSIFLLYVQLYLFEGVEKIACPMPELPPPQRWAVSGAIMPMGSASGTVTHTDGGAASSSLIHVLL